MQAEVLTQMSTTLTTEIGDPKKRATRDKTIGVRVSEEEFALLEQRAWKAGKVAAEYARDILLDTLHGSMLPRLTQQTLTEVVAVRLLLLNLLPAFAKQELPGIEELREFIAQVDQEKLQIVRDQIRQWKEETEEQP